MLHSRTPVFIHSLFNSLHPPARPPRLPPPPSQLSASLALFSCGDSSFVSQFRSVDSCCCVPPKWQIGSLFSKSALTFSHRCSAHRCQWALPVVRPEVLGRRQWPGHTPAPTEHGAWSWALWTSALRVWSAEQEERGGHKTVVVSAGGRFHVEVLVCHQKSGSNHQLCCLTAWTWGGRSPAESDVAQGHVGTLVPSWQGRRECGVPGSVAQTSPVLSTAAWVVLPRSQVLMWWS